jgi:hypothetical protein
MVELTMEISFINKCFSFLYKERETNHNREWCLCAFSSDKDILRIMEEYYPEELNKMKGKRK